MILTICNIITFSGCAIPSTKWDNAEMIKRVWLPKTKHYIAFARPMGLRDMHILYICICFILARLILHSNIGLEISCYKCIVAYTCFCRQCDKSIWSVEARLQLPKAWKNKILQYKYYVVTGKQPSDDNYEHIAHGGGIHNRCLDPSRNVYYDARGNSSILK